MKTQPTKAERIEAEAINRHTAYEVENTKIKAKVNQLENELMHALQVPKSAMRVDDVYDGSVRIYAKVVPTGKAKAVSAQIIKLRKSVQRFKSLDDFRNDVRREMNGSAIRPDVVQMLLKK